MAPPTSAPWRTLAASLTDTEWRRWEERLVFWPRTIRERAVTARREARPAAASSTSDKTACQSARMAMSGSTLPASRAGNQDATSVVAATTVTATAKVTGSEALSPKS